MKQGLSRQASIAAAVGIGLVTILAATALALSNIALTLGTVASYDFGGYGPGYPVPGTVQIHAFTMHPGDSLPWHYHKGVSFVMLAQGSLTEQHLVGANQCESEELTAGSAFVESPGAVHNVTNTGSEVAVIWWATLFPISDEIVQFTPDFRAGGVYPVEAPQCQ
jgi:hypothetical protein